MIECKKRKGGEKMKKLIVIFLVVIFALGVSILAYAQNPEAAKPQEKVSIEERKAKLISSIDERIKMLQEEKACVSAAKTPEDLRKCRGKVKEERKEFRQEMKEQRGK
jgi:hypothetical protein